MGILGFGDERGDGQRRRRDADADQPHLFVDDHLLDDAARIVGDAAVVAHDDVELAPGDDVAVLRNVKLEGGCELPADGVEPRPGQRQADAHLENLFGVAAPGAEADGGAGRDSLEHRSTQHHVSLKNFCPYFRFLPMSLPAADRDQAGSRWGICGRSPAAFPLIGARGRRAVPASMTKLWVSEYHGGVTSAAGADPLSCRTKFPSK